MDRDSVEMAMLWVLNQSDGSRTLLDIARRAALPFAAIRVAADELLAHDLLAEVPCPDSWSASCRRPVVGRAGSALVRGTTP